MKYEITVKNKREVKTVNVSSIRELHDTLCLYKQDGYKVTRVSNAFGRPRGILSVSFN